MEPDAEIPCSTCLLWNQENKRFSCDPNKCERLSRWLLKHAKDTNVDTRSENIQYVV
ncbi:MAG: hypothetical protein NWE99_05735 [Candidatus Bathyarchaeota archaeon]|nr:hypothetical protein [Candidatus Bathyarchaeota archaeon]